MVENILAGILGVIALLAGLWSWLVDKGYSFGKDNNKKSEKSEEN